MGEVLSAEEVYTFGNAGIPDTTGAMPIIAANNTVALALGKYNGAISFQVANTAAGTCTIKVQGYDDTDNWATAQDILDVGFYKLADSGAGVNAALARLDSLAIAATTTYRLQVLDLYKLYRVNVSGKSGAISLTIRVLATP